MKSEMKGKKKGGARVGDIQSWVGPGSMVPATATICDYPKAEADRSSLPDSSSDEPSPPTPSIARPDNRVSDKQFLVSNQVPGLIHGNWILINPTLTAWG
jgi:hypothetical protein